MLINYKKNRQEQFNNNIIKTIEDIRNNNKKEITKIKQKYKNNLERFIKDKEEIEKLCDIWYNQIKEKTFDKDYNILLLQSEISYICKNPGKQSCEEKYLQKEIEKEITKNMFKEKLIKLNGKDSIYFSKNSNEDFTKEKCHSIGKSIDFSFGNDIYICAKYTEGQGGAQDNQYFDVLTSINCINNLTTYNSKRFAIICDGDYYTSKNKEGKTKIDELNLNRKPNAQYKVMETEIFIKNLSKGYDNLLNFIIN